MQTLEDGRQKNILGRAGIVNWLYILGESGHRIINDNLVIAKIIKKWFRCFLPREYPLVMKARENVRLLIESAATDLTFWDDSKSVFYVHLINEVARSNLMPVIPNDIIRTQIFKTINSE
jgi:hypothetical protein